MPFLEQNIKQTCPCPDHLPRNMSRNLYPGEYKWQCPYCKVISNIKVVSLGCDDRPIGVKATNIIIDEVS